MTSNTKVLLTGGSGFIAAHILELLLEKGYNVVTTVRSEDKAQKIRGAHPELGKDRLDVAIVPDIAQPGAFDEVVKTPGIEFVLHTASPFHLRFDDPKELINPAVIGTTSILKAIARSAPAVKRVVITSSFAAVMDEARLWNPDTVFSESSWNPITLADVDASKSPAKMSVYRASKKLAEAAAWDFVRDPQNNATFDLVTLCPPMVFGPVVRHFASLEAVNTSNERIVNLVTGKWRAEGNNDNVIPETGPAFIWVDVRDLAAAHVGALEKAEAGGKRLFTTAGTFSNRVVYDIVRRNFPEYKGKIPVEAEVKGGEITPEDKRYKFDNSATNAILGIKWRSIEESIVDAVKSFQSVGA